MPLDSRFDCLYYWGKAFSVRSMVGVLAGAHREQQLMRAIEAEQRSLPAR
jgi:hypothetical protein